MNPSPAYASTVIQLFGAPSMIEENPDSRQVMVQITDPTEIASIKENGYYSILGYESKGVWWAYKFSVDQYRQRKSSTVGERNEL